MEETGAPLDLAKALTVVGEDRALLVELAQVFLDELPARLEALRGAVAGVDADGTLRAAHNLKGALATLGATRARELAYELEQLGRVGQLSPAPPVLAALEQELTRVIEFLATPGWADAPDAS